MPATSYVARETGTNDFKLGSIGQTGYCWSRSTYDMTFDSSASIQDKFAYYIDFNAEHVEVLGHYCDAGVPYSVRNGVNMFK